MHNYVIYPSLFPPFRNHAPKSSPLVSTLYIVANHGKVLVEFKIPFHAIVSSEKETGIPQSLQMLSMKGLIITVYYLATEWRRNIVLPSLLKALEEERTRAKVNLHIKMYVIIMTFICLCALD